MAINPKTGKPYTPYELKCIAASGGTTPPVTTAETAPPYPTDAPAPPVSPTEPLYSWDPVSGQWVVGPTERPQVPPRLPTTPVAPSVPEAEPAVDLGDMSPYFEAGEMLTAPISEYEQQALDMLKELVGQLGGMPSPHETPMGQDVGAALTQLLSGEFPEEYFQTSIAEPTRYAFEEETLPGIREAFVGPGTYWGGARAAEESKRRGEMEMSLSAIRGDLGYKAQQMALQALGPGMEYMGLPVEQALKQMTGAGAYMAAGALPRLIEQHGLDIAYQEFIRTRPENQPYAQMLLSMLGIPMMASYAQEEPESVWPSIFGAIGSIGGAYLGGL